MYNNTSYEDYMRNVLGYSANNCMEDTYRSNNCYEMPNNNFQTNNELESLYPDIYRVVYPLVCNECNMNTMPITEECIEKMIDNVYKSIEVDLKLETNVKVEFRKDNRNTNSRQMEDRETRQRRDNRFLRDLIRILILRELLQRGNRPGGHPPFPGGGRLPFPGPRPIMPREF